MLQVALTFLVVFIIYVTTSSGTSASRLGTNKRGKFGFAPTKEFNSFLHHKLSSYASFSRLYSGSNSISNDNDTPAIVAAADDTQLSNTNGKKKNKLSNLQLRWITGCTLGAGATYLIFSPKWVFTLLFTSIMAGLQREYFRLVRSSGTTPASKTGYVASLFFFTIAAYFPAAHELVLPGSLTFLMVWLLLFKKSLSSINEMSSTLLGVIYFGFLPSFWLRLRYEFGPALQQTLFNQFGSSAINADWLFSNRSFGAMVLWWTWCSIVWSDVGAFFCGKSFGKNKLSQVCKAAGDASPNKTVEGALGGFFFCTAFFTLGSFLMQWPKWQLWGPAYGLIISILGLVGDLTASMMKRDAKIKDSGGLLPGHGGLIDRLDSYLLSGPICYVMVKQVVKNILTAVV